MNLRYFAAFFAGGVLGGIGTWYGVKKHYETIANEEIESVKKYYYDCLEKAEKDNLNEELETYETDSAEEENDQSSYKTKTDYTSYYKNNKPPLEVLKASMEFPDDDINTEDYVEFHGEDTQEVECVAEPDPKTLSGPTIISEEEYTSDWRLEKVTITYYSGDETLADEDDTIIDDVDRLVSYEALKLLVDEDLDAVYVRNERVSIDYEVVLNNGRYSEIVLGLTDEDEDEMGGKIPMKNKKERFRDEE